MTFTDWIGFIGVFQILLAYAGHALGKLEKTNLLYILLNLLGASLACLASVLIEYMPFIILEGIWAIVSLISLFKFFRTSSIVK